MVGRIAFDIAAGIFGEKVTVEYEGNSFETTAVFEQVREAERESVQAHEVQAWFPVEVKYGAVVKRGAEVWRVLTVSRVGSGDDRIWRATLRSHIRPVPR